MVIQTLQTTRQTVSAELTLELLQRQQAGAILSVLQQHAGKKLTRKLEPALTAAVGEPVSIVQQYGMTTLQSETYWRSDADGGVRLTLGHGDTLPLINTEEIQQRNPAYFAAADKRIAERESFLAGAGPELVDAAAEALRQAQAAYKGLAGPAVLTDWPRIARGHGFTPGDAWL
jgi:hypothetical protein